MVNLLIYSLPALGWGMMPIISRKIGGKPTEQLVGTTIAATLVAIMINLLYSIDYTLIGFFIAMLSGVFWGFGQLLQFIALKKADVSKVMPISNGTQLLFTSLSSGILLREWESLLEVCSSLIVILLILVAIQLFSKEVGVNTKRSKISGSVVMILVGSSLCLTGYVTITNLFNVKGLSVFLPQSIGMLGTAALISLFWKEKLEPRKITGNLLTGFAWVIANISLFYAASRLGLGLSYTISQLCVFVSIIGGIILLKEHKNSKEKFYTFLGMVLFLVSIYILSLFK